jgi:hypothetical protein
MKKISCIGIVSLGCGKCEKLLARLKDDFCKLGVELDVTEYVYEVETDAAMKAAEEFGLDDLPSFYVAGVVFRDGYTDSELGEAHGNIR